MGDCKNQGNAGNKTHLSIKTKPTSVFNRSMTAYAPSAAAQALAAVAVAREEKTSSYNRNGSMKGNAYKGNVKKLCSVFDSPKHQQSISFDPPHLPSHTPWVFTPPDSPDLSEFSSVRLPGTEDSVVIYFTSLRGIRRTFHDCQSVRMVFRGLRVNVDERDLSMDVAYKKELQELFGEKNVSLPQVFIKGNHIGGAELVLNLLEVGELVRMIKGLPLRSLKPCDVCDDVKFIACVNCGGSRKVFDDDKDQINRCPVCNENGLMRCPICCSSSF
ncbi:hypothetical protein C2S52_017488 [Perilla frutescens var. hirtella]|uniref:Glutaredoxin domain-containing protein n=1 Tax=Perilla frutescens var. hirtella TaxID=608512 RepID=A0AAD4IYB8_PERFH|nr:hypothetical protein C2S52_017488 [Perilla frutescens var. hirtella]KAH6823687.1 hypothetical protein C2S53_004423 [Perilla frutescens var. hirtella]